MRIALMTNNYKPICGGVPISIERLKKGLEQLGHEVTVFAPSYENQAEEDGVIRYGNLLNHFIGGIVLPNPLDSKIEEQFQKREFDIIHVHHPFLIGNTAMHLSKKYHIPLAFTYHTQYEKYLLSYAPWARPLAHLLPAYLRLFMKHCDYLFAPTEGMREYLYETCHVPYEKMALLPTGLPEDNFLVTDIQKKEVRERYHAEEIPLFISVSRMAQEKNVSFLIESLARVKDKCSKPFRVLMIGNGPDRAAYERLCEEKGLSDTVIFTGKIDNAEIAPYFAAADAFLFASKTETQGIVILEAFAGKTPVFALDADGVRDLVTDGENGALLPEDETVFAERLAAVLDGREAVAGLSENAYETALTFREEAVAAKAIRLYNRIIASYDTAGKNPGRPAKIMEDCKIYITG